MLCWRDVKTDLPFAMFRSYGDYIKRTFPLKDRCEQAGLDRVQIWRR